MINRSSQVNFGTVINAALRLKLKVGGDYWLDLTEPIVGYRLVCLYEAEQATCARRCTN